MNRNHTKSLPFSLFWALCLLICISFSAYSQDDIENIDKAEENAISEESVDLTDLEVKSIDQKNSPKKVSPQKKKSPVITRSTESIPVGKFYSELGFVTSGLYQFYNQNNSSGESEFGGFGVYFGSFYLVNIARFFHIIPRVGLSISGQNTSHLSVGGTFALPIHLSYSPFFGISTDIDIYFPSFPLKKTVFTTYFTMGSKIFRSQRNQVWLFLDYMLFQSLYPEWIGRQVRFSLAYSYTLQKSK